MTRAWSGWRVRQTKQTTSHHRDDNDDDTDDGGGSTFFWREDLLADEQNDTAGVVLADMRKNRYKYFRWTPRTAMTSLIYVVAVPFLVGVLAYKTDVRTPPPLLVVSKTPPSPRPRARAHTHVLGQDIYVYTTRLIGGPVTTTGQIQLPGEEKGRSYFRVLDGRWGMREMENTTRRPSSLGQEAGKIKTGLNKLKKETQRVKAVQC